MRSSTDTEQQAFPQATWRRKVALWLSRLADEIDHNPSDKPVQRGVRMVFTKAGMNMDEPVYAVTSIRGGLHMGTISFSNQWRAWKFTPEPTAVYDAASLAEIYAKMRGMAR